MIPNTLWNLLGVNPERDFGLRDEAERFENGRIKESLLKVNLFRRIFKNLVTLSWLTCPSGWPSPLRLNTQAISSCSLTTIAVYPSLRVTRFNQFLVRRSKEIWSLYPPSSFSFERRASIFGGQSCPLYSKGWVTISFGTNSGLQFFFNKKWPDFV